MSDLKSIQLSRPSLGEIIPSTRKPVKIRPFTVGDEKLLLIASESKEPTQMATALMEIVEACIEGDPGKMQPYDYEYLFLKIRAVSVGETSDVGIKCKKCEAPNLIKVNLSNVEVKNIDKFNDFIKFDDNLGFKMKIPPLSETADVNMSSVEQVFKLILSCVDSVYYGEDVIEVTDSNRADLQSIIDQMSSDQFLKLKDFYESIPKVSKNIEFTCGSCNNENKLKMEGLASFF